MIVHEAPKNCGLGGGDRSSDRRKGLLKLEAPVLRVTGQDITVPLAKNEDFYYPIPQRILLFYKKTHGVVSMAKEFKFPDIGEGITEGEIVKWLVKEGDTVEEDQTLAEVETDKAVVEIPSPYAGTVLKLHFQEKDIVKVGQTLVTIGESGRVFRKR